MQRQTGLSNYDNQLRHGGGSNGGLSLISDSAGKHMRFTYLNSDNLADVLLRNKTLLQSGGTTFTGQRSLIPTTRGIASRLSWERRQTALIRIMTGCMWHCRIRQAMSLYYLNPDANAAQNFEWTSWYSALRDINAMGLPQPVKLSSVSGFCLGFGVRCSYVCLRTLCR